MVVIPFFLFIDCIVKNGSGQMLSVEEEKRATVTGQ